MTKIKLSPAFVGFLQTVGFLIYIALFGIFMINANTWFGPMKNYAFFGPMLFMSIFVFSAIICASMMLGYPFYIFWEKKDFKTAAKIVASSALWLFIFIIFSCILLATKL